MRLQWCRSRRLAHRPHRCVGVQPSSDGVDRLETGASADMSAALADALRARGVPPLPAELPAVTAGS